MNNDDKVFTDRVKRFKEKNQLGDRKLAEILGIARMTLYSRIKKGGWKKPEKYLIRSVM